ncbi:MAG: hypothetical protein ACO1NZ_17760, partial [Adhaeribacter sp.]
MNKLLQIITISLLFFSPRFAASQTHQYQWISQAAGTQDQPQLKTATDNSGNSYVLGYYSGSTTIATNPATTLAAPTSGTYGIFVAKFNALGVPQWARKVAETSLDQGGSIAIDGSGNAYIFSSFTGTYTYTFSNPGYPASQTIASTNNGGAATEDAFAAKFSTSGTMLWVSSGGGTGKEEAGGIAVDNAGTNVYVTGTYTGNPSFGGQNLGNSGTGSNLFLVKLAGNYGQIQWMRGEGSTSYSETAKGIALDNNNNPVVTGTFNTSTTFQSVTLNGKGGDDTFVSRYDANGNLAWSQAGGGAGTDDARSVSTDNNGNIYIGGTYTTSADFRNTTLNSRGSTDMFLAKYSNNGNLSWAISAGGSGADQLQHLKADRNGNIYATGSFSGTAYFNNGTTQTSTGGTDAFVARYSTTGTLQWVFKAGGSGNDAGTGLGIDGPGNAYLSGYFSGSATFSNGVAADDLQAASQGGTDGFLTRLAPPLVTIDSQSNNNSFCYNDGRTWTANYTTASTFNAGNEFIMQLSDYKGDFSNPTTFGRKYATTSGSVPVTFPNLPSGFGYRWRVISTDPAMIGDDNGANVTIINSADGGNGQLASSNNITCAGGTLQLFAPTANDGVYRWTGPNGWTSNQQNPVINNVTPSHSGTYQLTLSNGVCQATSSTQVTISNPPSTLITPSGSTSICPGSSVTLTAGVATSYLWSKDGSPIPGATARSLLVTEPGNYAVELSNGCSRTSATTTVTSNSLPVASAGPDQVVCAASALTLNSSGGTSYVWTGPNGFTSGSQNPVINNITSAMAGTYTVTVSNAAGCTATDQVMVTVKPLPVANAGADQTICAGTKVNIGTAEVSGNTYLWNTGAGTPVIEVSPAATTTYTLTVTSADGCIATDQVTVTVNPLPVADAGTDKVICIGASATIGTAAVAGNTYLWSTGATTATISVSPSATTTYTLTVRNAAGCTSTDQATVSVNPLPVANAGADQAICAGASASIGTASVAGNTYSWSTGANTPTISVSPAATSTYTLTVTSASGCVSTDQVVVTVNPLPVANAGADQAICVGTAATIGTAAVAGNTY